MEYIAFGNTGLKASKAGLGCGGHSRLGQSYGFSSAQSVKLVRAAFDLGVNFIDTAAAYGTENIVGQALKTRRDQIIVSTKAVIINSETKDLVTPKELRESLENSLRNLDTDYIDFFHLHAVAPARYDDCRASLVPELQKFVEAGKIRFVGITEQFIKDTRHEMLEMAVKDDFWDVMMVGFNMLNPSARDRVFAHTTTKGIATLGMFAVRKALSDNEALRALLQGLIDDGKLDDRIDMNDPLGFLYANGDASSVANAAYRFCSNEAGVDVVLTGTGNVEHLLENTTSISDGALCEETLARLQELFGHIDSVSGN